MNNIGSGAGFSRVIVSRFLKTNESVGSTKKRRGPEGSENPALVKIAWRDRLQTGEHIRRVFVEEDGIEWRTIPRRLQDGSLCTRKPAKKPLPNRIALQEPLGREAAE